MTPTVTVATGANIPSDSSTGIPAICAKGSGNEHSDIW
jgi:hypothetical protein